MFCFNINSKDLNNIGNGKLKSIENIFLKTLIETLKLKCEKTINTGLHFICFYLEKIEHKILLENFLQKENIMFEVIVLKY